MKGVIFDLDGTLLDTLPDISDNINVMLSHFGFKNRTEKEVMAFIGNGASKIVERSIGLKLDEARFNECLKYYNTIYTASGSPKTKLFDGVDKLLCTLKERQFKLAILTNKPQATTDKVYEKYLKDFSFDLVVGERGGVPKKPDKTSTLNIIKELNLEKGDVYFVGDGETDVLTAINSGVKGIAALWGYRSEKTLREVGATRFASSPLSLLDIIK